MNQEDESAGDSQLEVHRDGLLAAADRLVDHYDDQGIVAAFVFGSVAWGDADESSDLDLMICLSRDDDFREIRRIAISDGEASDERVEPVYADVDVISWQLFRRRVQEGAWEPRIVRSIILRDTNQRYANVRSSVSQRSADPGHRKKRMEPHRDAALELLEAGKSSGSKFSQSLLLRLAVESATKAFLEASGVQFSAAHFDRRISVALDDVGSADLLPKLRDALGIANDVHLPDRGVVATVELISVLEDWLKDRAVVERLTDEEREWSWFTCSSNTRAQIERKVAALTKKRRFTDTFVYTDNVMKTVIRMNVGRVLNLITNGSSSVPSVIEFHEQLRSLPQLFAYWADGLRLTSGSAFEVERARGLVRALLEGCDLALKSKASITSKGCPVSGFGVRTGR